MSSVGDAYVFYLYLSLALLENVYYYIMIGYKVYSDLISLTKFLIKTKMGENELHWSIKREGICGLPALPY